MRISDWSSDVCSSDLLSGPAILQISSYWQPGQEIEIDLQPGQDGFELLRETKAAKPKQELHMLLSEGLPRRLALMLCEEAGLRSEEHTSELQSLMHISYAVFCLKKKTR